MAESIPPTRAATVSDLHHTPVTLGVVLTVQAVALGAVLLVAGVLWGQLGTLGHKIDSLQTQVSTVEADIAAIKAAVVKP